MKKPLGLFCVDRASTNAYDRDKQPLTNSRIIGTYIDEFNEADNEPIWGIEIDSLKVLFDIISQYGVVIYKIGNPNNRMVSYIYDDIEKIKWENDVVNPPSYVIEIYDDYRE
jgi:hypothetical protein